MLECSRWFREKFEVKRPAENPCRLQSYIAQASLLFSRLPNISFQHSDQSAKQQSCWTKKPVLFSPPFFFLFKWKRYRLTELMFITVLRFLFEMRRSLILPATLRGPVQADDSVPPQQVALMTDIDEYSLCSVLTREQDLVVVLRHCYCKSTAFLVV